MSKKSSGARTLLWSVIMSSPGPLVVGLGLLAGRSSTQIADFVRRSSELLAILMAFVVFRLTDRNGSCDPSRRKKLERISNLFVGAMMCLGGVVMIVLAFLKDSQGKGNVVPGLAEVYKAERGRSQPHSGGAGSPVPGKKPCGCMRYHCSYGRSHRAGIAGSSTAGSYRFSHCSAVSDLVRLKNHL